MSGLPWGDPTAMTQPKTRRAGKGFLGIEGGATRSVSILAAAGGRCLKRIEIGAPANYKLLDREGLGALLAGIAVRFPRPAAVGIGLAGVLEEGDRAAVRQAAGEVWPAVPCWAGNDLETGLAAAQAERGTTVARVIAICGTGSACFGKAPDGKTVLAGGWGHLLGDRGSGHEIGLRACREVFRAYDETGRWPALGERLAGVLGLESPAGFVDWIGGASKAEIAALATEVFDAWGDPIAMRVLKDAAGELAATANACARRLVGDEEPVEFVLTGSVLTKQPGFVRDLVRRLSAARRNQRVHVLSREAAWGAVEMARRAARPEAVAFAADEAGTAHVPTAGIDALLPVARGMSPTEERNPRSRRLDRMSVAAAVRLMLEEDAAIPAALLREQRKIRKAVDMIVRAFRGGGRLLYVGAGTSGRLGALDASECPPTFGAPAEMVQAVMAGGDEALKGALEDAEDDFEGGGQALRRRGAGAKDVVVGIAASGRTPFVWGALHAARELGAATILVCFNPRLSFRRAGPPDLVIAPETGPEVLTGSTRLKAGTATKLVLNIFTTLAMVRLGKVMENLMIDLRPTNDKLRLRAIRIVGELTGVSAEVAEAELRANGWQVKRAVERLRRGRRR